MFKINKPTKKIRSFTGDESGVAAMEFVLVFPILMTLFLGCIELYGHFNAVRKLSNVTASLADIVAQSRSISASQLTALRPLAKNLMAPLNAASISYTITAVRQGNADQDPKLVWQQSHFANGSSSLDDGGNGACVTYTGAPGKNFPPNQETIYVSTQYIFNSAFSEFLGGATTYSDTMLAVPRSSNKVELTDDNSPCS